MRTGLDRYRSDLPVAGEMVSLGEGDTPLLRLRSLAENIGIPDVFVKDESCNPTGSYKDRIAAVSLSLAREQGKSGWIATSSGNAGVAMAAYGARVGLAGVLCLVSSAPAQKLLSLAPYRVDVLAVENIGNNSTARAIEGVVDVVLRSAKRHNLFLGITAHRFNQDGMRGVDTISYELSEQAPETTHVYVPVGGGGLLAGVARGLRSRNLPARVVACQPRGCAPVVRFLDGELADPVLDRCESMVSALQIPSPPDGAMAAGAVRASEGWGVTVSDEAIFQAQALMASCEGIFVEPAAAVTVAALIRDVERGVISERDTPTLILSGAGWKDLGRTAVPKGWPIQTSVDSLEEQVDRLAPLFRCSQA
ncbi:threonine synthase [Prauserella marina]|uniref:Threonine synthase n=3 Tax=Prauserella marina TaxID=530584 RepID=A0A1G6UJR3_9PSEU|nr:threonine synthase [Prauserella marina]SDD41509.1 threonine synthase [Prauserella marina]